MVRFLFNTFLKSISVPAFIMMMSLSTHSFARGNDQLFLECSLFISRSNGAKPVVDIKRQPLLLGYSSPHEFNELQPMFILSQTSPKTSFLKNRAVMARLYPNHHNRTTVLEVGFFQAKIKYENSSDTYVSQHPTLSAWQFEPVEVFSFEFDSDIGSDDIDVLLNNHVGAKITGNTNYKRVELDCSTE